MSAMSTHLEETRAFWNRVADDWHTQVGSDGDANRRLNSDPVLWSFAGDVRGLAVLDAGCGTGYLSRQLADRGAHVIGIDFSERMIAVARAAAPALDFRVDTLSTLSSIADGACDLIVSNYVLMDTPDLEAAVRAFHRVLTPGGAAVLVFSHPCFPGGRATPAGDGVAYAWDFPYFERRRCVDPPWGHFTSEFIWFHRPLSDYWKAFAEAGFTVAGFEEPRLTPDRFHLAGTAAALHRNQSRPYSVVFKLQKPPA
jgi:SAM-dependent methyltransferase